MPYLGVPDILFFEEAIISKFLKKFENIFDNYQMSISEKIRGLSRYYKIFIAWHIRAIIKFSGLDLVKTYTSLKKKYKDKIICQQISSHIYLKVFKNKPKIENTKVFLFWYNYFEISKELLDKKKLDKYTQLRCFLQVLSFFIQFKLIN